MNYFLAFLLGVSFVSNANDGIGVWGTSCNDDGFYFPFEQKISPLVVNDNQIVISVHSIIKNGVADVYLDGPLDLGRGGMEFKWGNIDKSKKIAELEYANKTGYLKWLGFFDNKENRYFWTDAPDFVQSYSHSGIIKMTKCE